MRKYYSNRMGINDAVKNLDLKTISLLFKELYGSFDERCYFQEAFGFFCVDAGKIYGTLGSNIESQIFLRLRKDNLWPIENKYEKYSEEDLFDMIEFIFDFILKPLEGRYHTYSDCGWHYNIFNQEEGRREYQTRINEILADYGNGYELSPEGEILHLSKEGLDTLVETEIPQYDPENVDKKIKLAINKYRQSRSSLDEQRGAIRELADILEFLRPQLKNIILKKDEDDLFNIANNFGIRHHNEKQKTDYDQEVWYTWMFYYYLSTIYAVISLLNRHP